MRVESSASIFDEDDKRCLLNVQRSVGLNGTVYLITVSCFDKDTGAINWYHGVTPQHFHDFDEKTKPQIIETIMNRGGDVWKLQSSLLSSYNYLNGLSDE